ncbi:WD40/YVTN/BNR-like repeat-containing protein [Fredinandcohnia sp. 179-A 10B2 NHS]|uniref:WD40/YVTN/BNR-like repeat-containing protein n=1 Tax=Fredinandcohnia sp. 179-A 10B2 NHS TaxID=3235176 RepID=UPI0039A2829F
MNKLLISISGIIVIGLLLFTYFYERTIPLSPPDWENKINENTSENEVQPQEEELLVVDGKDSIGYSLQNDQLQITWNNGEEWVTVPIGKDLLFSGEYNGNKSELIEGSYILSENRVAFLYTDEPGMSINLMHSQDEGQTWQNSVVAEQFPPIRFRKVNFLNEKFGYVILSGDRTMSQEWSTVFLTNDGGVTWKETNHSDVTRLLAGGGFTDENTGFLSYGILNPQEPDFYVTQDAGQSWTKANIVIPEEYHEIFVIAEVPYKEGEQLALLINQGPNGDYQGGKVKGKFISQDNGLTWEFSEEVDPDEQ